MNASQAIRAQAGNSIRRISRPVLWLGNLHRLGRYLTRTGRGPVGSDHARPFVAGETQGRSSLGYEPYCDTRSHVVSERVEEVWLMPGT
jgi:hypothetical protein